MIEFKFHSGNFEFIIIFPSRDFAVRGENDESSDLCSDKARVSQSSGAFKAVFNWWYSAMRFHIIYKSSYHHGGSASEKLQNVDIVKCCFFLFLFYCDYTEWLLVAVKLMPVSLWANESKLLRLSLHCFPFHFTRRALKLTKGLFDLLPLPVNHDLLSLALPPNEFVWRGTTLHNIRWEGNKIWCFPVANE